MFDRVLNTPVQRCPTAYLLQKVKNSLQKKSDRAIEPRFNYVRLQII